MTPPSTKPSRKPRGPENPSQAKERLRGLPNSTLLETIATEAGTTMAFTTPWRARKAMSAPPVFERPQPMAVATNNTFAAIMVTRQPMTSVMEPASIRHDPAVK